MHVFVAHSCGMSSGVDVYIAFHVFITWSDKDELAWKVRTLITLCNLECV